MQKAATGGMMEVDMGAMAQERGASDQVKQFGARMVKDHGMANDELRRIAGAKGVTLPAKPDKSMHRDSQKMAAMSGADFDRAYMKHMVDDHKKDVALFKKAADSSKDGELKAFAAKTLPAEAMLPRLSLTPS